MIAGARAGETVGSAKGQGGFALMAVLAVIGLTSITIAALMGMMLTTLRITAAQERSALEARAADGAVTATVNRLRLNQATSPTDPCRPSVPVAGMRVPFASVDGPGDVLVTCTRAADDLGAPGGETKLVGTRYSGPIVWKNWNWAAVPVSVSSADAALVHSGPQALQFNGNVSSVGGVAALRTDAAGTPAMSVRGRYAQAGVGLGAASECGVLSGAAVRASTAVVASAGVTCGDPSLVPAAVEQEYAIDVTVPVVSALSSACPTATVISFTPGRYDQMAVATLNKWFGRSGGCSGKTFHFAQGRYWFDANTVGAPAADRHALIFDNPTSNFVFGASSGWSTDPATGGATAADFPTACTAGATAGSGASIILSARTEFRHLSGRLAVCPYLSAENVAYPTLLQQRTVPTKITVRNPSSTDFVNPQNLISKNSSAAAGPALFTCSLPANGFSLNLVYCNSPAKSFTVQLTSPLDGASTSATVRLTGNEVNFGVSGVRSRLVTFRVTLASGVTCDVPASPGLPDKARTASYNLLSGGCATTITNGAQLEGASIRASIAYRYAGICLSFSPCPIAQAQSLSLWDVDVLANSTGADAASAAGSPASGWVDVANVRANDSAAAELKVCPPGQANCGGSPTTPFTRSVQLGAIGTLSSGPALAADARVDSFGIVIRQIAPNDPTQTGFDAATLPGQTTFALTLADGTVCSTTVNGVANVVGDTYYPLLDPGASSCGAVPLGPTKQLGSNLLASASSPGSSLTVTYRLDCTGLILPDGKCAYFEPYRIQHIGLVAATDSYSGPVVTSQLNIDAANGSSANFFGPAYMQRTSLDIHWRGARTGASIFGGELQLHSLGSDMTATATSDVVCCTAPEVSVRKVRVTAWIGGEPQLSAVVALDRVGGQPAVLEWAVCGRNGTCPTSP